ncbi:MAG: hypothetical protein AAF828_01520 [Bacteroidota bacterium]
MTRILPSLKEGLEIFGLYEGLHYFVGERPPRRWRKSWGRPYQSPNDHKRYITFWNGTGMHLISHDVGGDGRGINSDWIIGDEAALLDPSKLQENTDPTRRGTNANVFEGKAYFGKRVYVSSTPITPQGRWMLEYEYKARENPQDILYYRATCQFNLHNLRKGYLQEARKTAYKLWIFNAEYLGIRPKFTRDSFYPLFDVDHHGYRIKTIDSNHYLGTEAPNDCRGDLDLVKGMPLILGADWGAAINCLTVNQFLRSLNEYRTLNGMYVLGDDQKIQEDLYKEFHEYYQYHNCREVYLWYDNTGNAQTGFTRRTRAQQAADQLRELGWKVSLRTTGLQNPQHDLKFRLWNYILAEDKGQVSYPRYRCNYYKTVDLRASIANAKATEGRNGETKKDKSSEKSTKIERQHATDLSDANDAPIFGMFGHLLHRSDARLPAPRIRTRRA